MHFRLDNFRRNSTNSVSAILLLMFLAHYSCATADTWASEVGILSQSQPRLVTSLFLRKVPHGTNGGASGLGLAFSALGGLFIGLIYFASAGFNHRDLILAPLCMIFGMVGSLIDSILGATVQATYYSDERKCIVPRLDPSDPSIKKICGVDLISNEAVNFYSILATMALAAILSPYFLQLSPQNDM